MFDALLKIDDCWVDYEKAALTDKQKAFLWKNRIEATERARRLKEFDNPSSGIYNLILALEKSLLRLSKVNCELSGKAG